MKAIIIYLIIGLLYIVYTKTIAKNFYNDLKKHYKDAYSIINQDVLIYILNSTFLLLWPCYLYVSIRNWFRFSAGWMWASRPWGNKQKRRIEYLKKKFS